MQWGRITVLASAVLIFAVTGAGGQGDAMAMGNSDPEPASSSGGPPVSAKPRPPMPRMEPGATAREFQDRMYAHARESGQTYSVDSAMFDPSAKVRSRAKNDPPQSRFANPSFDFLTPEQCRERPEAKLSNSPGGRIYNHYQVCAWEDFRINYKEYIKVFGVKVPVWTEHMDFRLTLLGYGSDSTSRVDMYAYLDDLRAGNNGKMTPSNTALSIAGGCAKIFGDGSCNNSSVASNWFSALVAGQHLNFTTNVALGASSEANPDAIYAFNLQHTLTARTTVSLDTPVVYEFFQPIRCDQATRGGFTGSACIYSDVLPGYSLNVNDSAIQGVALHIRDAMANPNSTKPETGYNKIIPNLLERTTDQALIKAQRDRSKYQCGKWWGEPNPPGKDCDEYPFASSYQGSYSTENDYSVLYVDSAQNQLEGSRRGGWYTADRILEGDRFLVSTYNG